MEQKSTPDFPMPTKTELEILSILWQKGPSTVREINEEIIKSKQVNYTSTLKMMQTMFEKKLVIRNEGGVKHIYDAAAPMEVVQQQILNGMVNLAFGGSASSLVMRLLGSKKASKEELASIKQMINDIENEKK
jgi:BlaI family transcriptional regulator, penicillinase repressor